MKILPKLNVFIEKSTQISSSLVLLGFDALACRIKRVTNQFIEQEKSFRQLNLTSECEPALINFASKIKLAVQQLYELSLHGQVQLFPRARQERVIAATGTLKLGLSDVQLLVNNS
jgi:hypothetical protein